MIGCQAVSMFSESLEFFFLGLRPRSFVEELEADNDVVNAFFIFGIVSDCAGGE